MENISIRSHRLNRERRTIQCMIEIYCRRHHRSKDIMCAECQALLEYAMQRIAKCPYQAEKPTCARCPIHCYKPEMRSRVRQVMREAGPWMMLYHPILTIRHMRDGNIQPPDLKSKAKKDGSSG